MRAGIVPHRYIGALINRFGHMCKCIALLDTSRFASGRRASSLPQWARHIASDCEISVTQVAEGIGCCVKRQFCKIVATRSTLIMKEATSRLPGKGPPTKARLARWLGKILHMPFRRTFLPLALSGHQDKTDTQATAINSDGASPVIVTTF